MKSRGKSRIVGRDSGRGLRPLLVACFIFSWLAMPATPSFAQVRITSRHKAQKKVSGEEGHFVRVGAARPLALQVTGPGTLILSLRKELDNGARGLTQVRLQRDGRRVGTLRLGAKKPVRLASGKGRVGAAQERRVSVPGGSHRFVIRVIGRGHGALVRFAFEADLGEMPALVSLTDSETGTESTPGPESSDPLAAIDLVPLVGLSPDPVASDPSGTEIASLDLVDLEPEDLETGPGDALASSGTPVAVDTIEASTGPHRPSTGGMIGAPLDSGPGAGPSLGPSKPGRLLLGLRGVAARVGLGSSAVGGGVDLLYRPGLLEGKLLVGLSIDYLPQELYRDVVYPGGITRRVEASLSSLPILLTGAYQYGKGRLSFWGMAGIGFSRVGVGRGEAKNSAIHPAAALAVGPALRLGPGHLTASLRLTASTGQVRDRNGADASAALSASTISSTGLTLGYAISI